MSKLVRSFVGLSFMVGALVLFGGAGTPGAASPRMHEAVSQWAAGHPGEPVPVIVEAKDSADPAALVRAAGGQVRTGLDLINAVAADVPAGNLEELATASGT